jgi:endonuclease/exonuclease/phosphatase (EEP) superfamily protein YafD
MSLPPEARNDPALHQRLPPRAVRWLRRVALGTALAAALGLLGDHHWTLDLLAHWRVQYAAVLAACAFGLLLLRRPRSAALALLGAGVLALSVLRQADGSPPPVQATSPSFRFVSFNRPRGERHALASGEWLERSGADVVALQELYTPQTVQALSAALPSFPHVHAQFGRWADVAIFSRWPILQAQTIELTPGGARAAQLRIDWRAQPITVVGVHLHWPVGANNVRQRNAALHALAALARDTPGPLLIGGDFNITQWSAVFDAAFATAPLQDCARGQGLVNSWPSFFPPAAIRIDHCLASPHWRVLQVSAGPALGSDHRPVLSELVLQR